MSRGRKAPVTIQPLTDAQTKAARKAAEPTPDVTSITDRDVLTRMWKAAPRDSAERAAIEARVAGQNTNPAPTDDGPSDAEWDVINAGGASWPPPSGSPGPAPLPMSPGRSLPSSQSPGRTSP